MANSVRKKLQRKVTATPSRKNTGSWPVDLRRLGAALALIGVFSLSACSSDPNSPRGFSLPQGSAEAGMQAFIDLECTACHSVSQLELPPPEEMFEISVMLGGPREQQITYGELVASIINPSYKLARGYRRDTIMEEDGESRMFIYNDVMTVTQLIDIVTFLEEHYEISPYDPTMNIIP